MTRIRAARIAALISIAALSMTACQDEAPQSVGAASVYSSGYIGTTSGRREIAIRLDRQACIERGDVYLRDASGLGELVIEQPFQGWQAQRYNWPAPAPVAIGYLEIAGIWSRFPLWRASTVITRVTDRVIDGDIDWTIGEPNGAFADTTTSRLRVVGRFSAKRSCR